MYIYLNTGNKGLVNLLWFDFEGIRIPVKSNCERWFFRIASVVVQKMILDAHIQK